MLFLGTELDLIDVLVDAVLGHEFMGEVVDVGKDNTRLKVGDRVVVPFTIAFGRCFFCNSAMRSQEQKSSKIN